MVRQNCGGDSIEGPIASRLSHFAGATGQQAVAGKLRPTSTLEEGTRTRTTPTSPQIAHATTTSLFRAIRPSLPPTQNFSSASTSSAFSSHHPLGGLLSVIPLVPGLTAFKTTYPPTHLESPLTSLSIHSSHTTSTTRLFSSKTPYITVCPHCRSFRHHGRF